MTKKMAQLIRKALQNYFDKNAVTKTVQEYKIGMLETISHDEVKVKLKNL